ncbi:unnamed protein product [Didymodactylos carnosus]|uniref:Uncharacterized protein n=1 Tax=Didymodactylos carnosus TaxID=1234261 RepID=A0A8S2CVE2_9BILA|nr:unnamed protein product [Didymodactylos carnosus]CAF3553064.1 unnamed protein product [Didymodactylos carnosus]
MSDFVEEWTTYTVQDATNEFLTSEQNLMKVYIDVYDTPGFYLIAIQDNLHELVKLFRPTLIFIYENASGTNDTHHCFIALNGGALDNLENRIFFLNTKGDVEQIMADTEDISENNVKEKFSEILLNERVKRYKLLLQIPSIASDIPGRLPSSLTECDCFDVVSTHSNSLPQGVEMNQASINRMIQFVANSDLKIAKKVTNLVLSGVQAFFNFALITSHRSREQSDRLCPDARQWSEFNTRSHFNRLLRDAYDNVLQRLSDEADAVQQDIVKVAVTETAVCTAITFVQLIVSKINTDDDMVKCVNLSQCFSENQNENWQGAENAIKEHIQRPEEYERTNFVEIRIPTPTLELGIDAYDTPGFLFHDDEAVLRENLYELVRLVRPTIIFIVINKKAYTNILKCFDERSNNIAERAARLNRSSYPIQNILVNLTATEIDQRNWFKRLIFNILKLPKMLSRLAIGIRTFPFIDHWNKIAPAAYKSEEKYYKVTDTLDSSENLTDETKRKDFASLERNLDK